MCCNRLGFGISSLANDRLLWVIPAGIGSCGYAEAFALEHGVETRGPHPRAGASVTDGYTYAKEIELCGSNARFPEAGLPHLRGQRTFSCGGPISLW